MRKQSLMTFSCWTKTIWFSICLWLNHGWIWLRRLPTKICSTVMGLCSSMRGIITYAIWFRMTTTCRFNKLTIDKELTNLRLLKCSKIWGRTQKRLILRITHRLRKSKSRPTSTISYIRWTWATFQLWSRFQNSMWTAFLSTSSMWHGPSCTLIKMIWSTESSICQKW